MNKKITILLILLGLMVIWGCSEETPRRDQIPILKGRLLDLQTAVKAHDRAAIDSLLSVKILDREQSSDSLLNFIYGADGALEFSHFGNYDIIYTNTSAEITCEASDSAGTSRRPVMLNYTFEHDLWLLAGFTPGETIVDTTQP